VFGSLGGSEVIFIFILALLLFGPRRLPEIGRTLGKAVGEFRKATQDFRMSLEREVELDKLKDVARSVETGLNPTLARGAILDAIAGPPVKPPTTPAEPAPTSASPRPEGPGGESPETPAPDGGSSAVH
jgi:sec-independent protein translocase protein TatB